MVILIPNFKTNKLIPTPKKFQVKLIKLLTYSITYVHAFKF